MTIIQPNVPSELVKLPQWVLWRIEIRKGKPTKVPYQARPRQLYRARSNDPRTWAYYETAVEMWRHHFRHIDGIGFVFSPNNGLCGIDLDNCYPSEAAECAPWAEGVLQRFADTYCEESPSGRGVKIWCRAKLPRCVHCIVEDGAIEIYDRRRYFTVTGRHTGVLAIVDHQHDVEKLVANLEGDRGATLSRTIGAMLPRGQRHPTLISLAGTMWRRCMDPEAVEAALLKVNEKQCDPPYPPEHIHEIIESMRRWPR